MDTMNQVSDITDLQAQEGVPDARVCSLLHKEEAETIGWLDRHTLILTINRRILSPGLDPQRIKHAAILQGAGIA